MPRHSFFHLTGAFRPPHRVMRETLSAPLARYNLKKSCVSSKASTPTRISSDDSLASDGELNATTRFTIIVRRPTSSFNEDTDWILTSHIVLVVCNCIFCVFSIAYVTFYLYRRVQKCFCGSK